LNAIRETKNRINTMGTQPKIEPMKMSRDGVLEIKMLDNVRWPSYLQKELDLVGARGKKEIVEVESEEEVIEERE
jgi:hypothetical protein